MSESKTPTMQTCKHERVLTFHYEVDGNPAPLWACPECDLKFVPITNELRLERELAAAVTRVAELERDAERYRWLRDHRQLEVLLHLFDVYARRNPDDELDAAIDAAMKGNL
jgi:hypothetical protein